MRVLFVCTGNRARSQMAEGWARRLAPPGVEVLSAGTVPNPKGVHPRAVDVMREKGVDIGGQRTKSLDDLPPGFDFVITVCAEADAACPTLPARLRRLQWHLPDPDRAGVGEAEELQSFREIRDELERRLRAFFEDAAFRKSLAAQKAAP
jgi:arsenate reductase